MPLIVETLISLSFLVIWVLSITLYFELADEYLHSKYWYLPLFLIFILQFVLILIIPHIGNAPTVLISFFLILFLLILTRLFVHNKLYKKMKKYSKIVFILFLIYTSLFILLFTRLFTIERPTSSDFAVPSRGVSYNELHFKKGTEYFKNRDYAGAKYEFEKFLDGCSERDRKYYIAKLKKDASELIMLRKLKK